MSQSSSEDKNSKIKKRRRDPRRITETYLYNSGLYYLQRFTASSAHFKTIMSRKIARSCSFHKDQNKDECLALLDDLVLKLQGLKLLDDAAYTRGMVISQRRRGQSRRMIQAKLQAKGLKQEIIKKELQHHAAPLEEDAELLAGLRLARRKKIGPYLNKEPDETQFKKALGIMARAGFSYDIALKILEMGGGEAARLSNLE